MPVNDTNGWHDLAVINVLVNDVLDGGHACYLAFTPANSQVYLVDDSGNALVPASVGVSGPASIQNSRCKITPVGFAASGNSLTLIFNANFSASFKGNRVIYAAARNSGTVNSGWQAMGTVQPK